MRITAALIPLSLLFFQAVSAQPSGKAQGPAMLDASESQDPNGIAWHRRPNRGWLRQSITFDPIPSQAVGAVLTLSATASSGLAVSFRSLTPAVCTASGTMASFSAAG